MPWQESAAGAAAKTHAARLPFEEIRGILRLWWDQNRFLSHWKQLKEPYEKALQLILKPFLLNACVRSFIASCELPAAPVLQLHIPKTAGSSIKSWANLTGYRVRPHGYQLSYGDGPYWIGNRARPASCSQRRSESATENSSWFPVERWLDLPLCDDFQYVVALREPVARSLHQFHHMFSYFRSSPQFRPRFAAKERLSRWERRGRSTYSIRHDI